ncbi:MAG: hypothetical protein IPK55_12215 [Streptococcus sp.]|nr:hypothetical protein [Streptococcus sp.]
MPAVKENEAKFDQSFILDEFDEQNISSGSSILEIPKFLLFASKNNKESYVFKKNAENYRSFFNINIILFAFVSLFS